MKNVLVYSTGGQGLQEASQREEAIVEKKKGNNVIFLCCDETLGHCLDNPLGSKGLCKMCKFLQKSRAKKYGLSNEFHFIGEYLSKEMEIKAMDSIFDYSTMDELKSIVYDGVEIGYGAVSTYVSLTRNMSYITPEIKKYLDHLLSIQIKHIEILKEIFKRINPELVYFLNGRFSQYKPLLGVSQLYNINFVCTEGLMFADGEIKKDYFHNNIAHDMKQNTDHYNKFWYDCDDKSLRESVGRLFFENRRFGKYAGDKIYTLAQQQGKMPSHWDNSKYNIVIFNSSEDEFFSVSKEVDSFSLFKSQLEGIETIINHYKDDPSKHFYLRIHPNLNGIPYSYHTDLYNFNYTNLTVIPGTSDISTYALMDAADKVIVFGSTMGVEAAYWKKPVICLGYALYNLLNVVHLPKTQNELWEMIENKNLPLLEYDNALKYGFYYMSEEHPKFKEVQMSLVEIKVANIKRTVLSYQEIFGSHLLYFLVVRQLNRILKNIGKRFLCVPK